MWIFGQKYGVINSIVLSRSAESDNVYLRDEESVSENGLTEVKIVDNQIMNFNNRSDYLQGILNALNGLYYYINDFSSTGIMYYEVGDLYNVQVGNNTYQCLMLNDEIDITTGIEEIIHTDLPEESETDYTKADKTDRKINQTYLIVDKQNQQIESVINTVNTQNNKISQITQTVDELNSKIQNIADITIAGETMQASLQLDNINESEPISINIHPIGTNISYLYPRNNLYPSDTLYMTDRKLRFIRTYIESGETLTETIDYELPDDLLYYDSNNYDEFILNYDSQVCQVRKKCKYNADGTVSLLSNEVVTDYPYPTILLKDGDYEIKLLGYNVGYLYVRLMVQNIYTTQFATKVELRSQISQTAEEINLEVSKKVGNDEIVSKINQSAEAITINANKIGLTANNILNIMSGNALNLTSKNITIASTNFNVDKNGNMSCSNANVSGTITATGGTISGWTITDWRLRSDDKKTGISSSTYYGDPAFWAGSTDPWEDSNWSSNMPFYVTNQGYLKATNADISGTITATSGTFENCTVKSSCNIPAGAIKSGTMDASRIYGGALNVSSVSAVSVGADAIGLNSQYGVYSVGNWTGESFQLIVQHEGQYWRRLTFKGGILVNVESSW